jgi:hypothetical protein
VKIIVGLFLGLMTLACTPQATQKQGGEKKMKQQLVTLHSVDPKSEHIVIAVTGYGCTLASQFKIEAVQEKGACRVSIYRTQFDSCLRSPMSKTLQIPWDAKKACGDSPIEIVNPQKPPVRHLLGIPNNSK